MTDEQIISLVKQYFKYDGICDDGSCFKCKYYGDPDTFLKFARIFWAEGFKVGTEYGYDEGWESSKVSTKMNTWSSDDD